MYNVGMDKSCTEKYHYGVFTSLMYGASQVLGEFSRPHRSKTILSYSNADALRCDIEAISEDYKIYIKSYDKNRLSWQTRATSKKQLQKEAQKR